jgi:hypothetical protein
MQSGGRDIFQGFVLIPQKIEEVVALRSVFNNVVYREVTVDEARDLVCSEYCTNREEASLLLDCIDKV